MIGLSKSRGALSMENQKMPEYETIRAAVAGEKWAVEKVVECYKDEIDRLSTVAVRQPDGSTKQEINEDMRQSITKKLIEALPQFPYGFLCIIRAEGFKTGEAFLSGGAA
jgi:hypothetical protein